MSDNEQDCMEDIFECTLPVPTSRQRGSLVTTLPSPSVSIISNLVNEPIKLGIRPTALLETQVKILQEKMAILHEMNTNTSIKIPIHPTLHCCSVSEKDLIEAGHTNTISMGYNPISDDTQNPTRNNLIIDRLKKENQELKDRISDMAAAMSPEEILTSIRARRKDKNVKEKLTHEANFDKGLGLPDNKRFDEAMGVIE